MRTAREHLPLEGKLPTDISESFGKLPFRGGRKNDGAMENNLTIHSLNIQIMNLPLHLPNQQKIHQYQTLIKYRYGWKVPESWSKIPHVF